jgi:hypothetical protein
LRLSRGERIPTLREALAFGAEKGCRINVEIKNAVGRACDGWIVERTVALIREIGLEGTALISSFNHDYLRRVRAASPSLLVGALVEKIPADAVSLLRELDAGPSTGDQVAGRRGGRRYPRRGLRRLRLDRQRGGDMRRPSTPAPPGSSRLPRADGVPADRKSEERSPSRILLRAKQYGRRL